MRFFGATVLKEHVMTPDPDPRTAPDDADASKTEGHVQDASNEGVSADEPAEGADTAPDAGSPKG